MNTVDFLNMVLGDPDLAKKMSGFTNTRDYYDEAVKMGLEDDYETFSKTESEMESDGLLSDDDLYNIAGGMNPYMQHMKNGALIP